MSDEQIKIKVNALTCRVIIFGAMVANFAFALVRLLIDLSVPEFTIQMILLVIINKFLLSLVNIYETWKMIQCRKPID